MEEHARSNERSRWRKRLIIAGAVLVAVLITIGYFLPYLLKRYIEKHSVEWIGRRITIDQLVLNPFTFTYGIYGLTCYEPHASKQVFVSWKEVSVKADLWSGWRHNAWRFHKARMRSPYVRVVQHGTRFNFSDLMELGGAPDTAATTDTTHTLFSIEDIQVTDGGIDYGSDLLKEDQGIRALNASCTRITSESARMDFELAFRLLKGGDVKGGFMIDTDRSLYSIDASLSSFALPQLLPYLQDFMHTTALKGALDLDVHLRDSWAADNALAVKGRLGLNDLAITDGQGEELIGLHRGDVVLDTLESRTDHFDLRRVQVDGLRTRYELFADGSDTWSKALKLAPDSAHADSGLVLAAAPGNVFVMLADYIRMLGQDFAANEYNADSLVFTNGAIQFNDFTPERPFRYTLSQVDMRTSRASSQAPSVDVTAGAMLNGHGRLKSSFAFDPKDFRNVQAQLTVDSLVLADLDPYGRWYAAFPILAGTLDYDGSTTIQAGRINSSNHILANKLKLGKRTDVHDTGIYVLPLRLAVSLLKDKDGVIDLKVPITGDLNDPTFKAWPIVWQVLKNLITKAAAAPGRLLARAVGGGDDEDVEEVRFDVLQTALQKEQTKALDALVDGLKAKPDLVVALVPLADSLQGAEELAAFRVKQQFLLKGAAANAEDSARILAFSVRDTSFAHYLDERSPTTKGRPERERCVAIEGGAAVASAWSGLETARRTAVQHYLTAHGIEPARCSFRKGTADERSGRTGRPGFRFVYDAGAD